MGGGKGKQSCGTLHIRREERKKRVGGKTIGDGKISGRSIIKGQKFRGGESERGGLVGIREGRA